MSEPRIISPLLDGFALGSSMSSHNGVNCYPAMREDSDERYIVKSISVPASQERLEALLLTGAFKTQEEARSYFEEQAQSIAREADVLNKLSKLGGFLPFQGCQVEPLEEGVGYEVCLVSDYRRSLERYLRRSPMTHLAAVNMGIDLCAAMVVCRESGYLYVDLKPSNVYLTGDQGYQVGDLGFVSLKDLKYASLPDRCRSDWTPPELSDAFAQLNTTMDTYAIGLMLYQVYNNGALPFDSEESKSLLMVQLAAGDPLPAPAYADYEMAQIILKACAYDPADRWQNPTEMGRALVAYMQRNGANDVPIAPPVVQDAPIAPVPDEADAESEASVSAEETGDAASLSDGGTASEEAAAAADEEAPEQPENDWIDRMGAILAEDGDSDSEVAEDDVSLRELLTGEQFVPVTDADPNVDSQELSEETAGMLDQADELLSIPVPEPPVAPEPIDIPIPEPIILPDDEEETPAEQDEPVIEEASEEPAEIPPEVPAVPDQTSADWLSEEEDEEEAIPVSQRPRKRKKRGKKLVIVLILLIIAALAGFGVRYAYNEYYLQEVTSLTVDGEGDQMTVSVVSEVDESLLTVVCVDQYGKKFSAPLVDGTATISGLDPDTQYTVTLEISGHHKLTGQTSAQYYTLPQVTVTSFTAITGSEDGSAILEFVTEGPTVENWTIQYAAAGEEAASIPFTGNTVPVSGLTPGTNYEFTLLAGDEVQLIGQTQLTHVASNVIQAVDLQVVGGDQNSLTATWSAPEGVSVDHWTVKCYKENDTSDVQTLEVTEGSATFTNLDLTATYTLEVLADGMSVWTRTYAQANPISITSVTPSSISSDSLVVTWEYQGNKPEGNWMLLYTVDEGDEQNLIRSSEPMAVIEPVAPGSHYDFIVQAEGATVFGGTGSIDIAEADPFDKYGLAAQDIEMMLCAAPEEEEWAHYDVDEENITTAFAVGTKVGIILHTTDTYNVEYNDVTATYVLRDSEGRLSCISTSSQTWESMWSQGYCELDVPTMPQRAGSYTLELFFDGALVATMQLTLE